MVLLGFKGLLKKNIKNIIKYMFTNVINDLYNRINTEYFKLKSVTIYSTLYYIHIYLLSAFR